MPAMTGPAAPRRPTAGRHRCATRGPRADPGAGIDLGRGPRASSFPADEPAVLGPGPHRRVRGSVAGAPSTAGALCCARTWLRSTTRWSRPAPTGASSPSCEPRRRPDYLDRGAGPDARGDRERGIGDGTVHELVLRHEHQHNETMLQTIELARLDGYRAGGAPAPAEAPSRPSPGSRWSRCRPARARSARRIQRLCLRQRAPPA